MFQRKFKFLLLICICSSIRAEEIHDCDYFDTVDLTYKDKLANGSYNYEGAMIPPDQIGTYNYKIFFEGTITRVEDHVRGCVCKFKPCIRYCCHRHRLDASDESKCTRELNDYQVNITLVNGKKQERNIGDQFVIQPGMKIQCSKDIHLVPYTINEGWKLFENGTLYRSIDNVYLSKRDYCIQPKELANQGYNYMLLESNCLKDLNLLYVGAASVLFVMLAICIFGIEQQLVYGKCCLCYLICCSASLLINSLIDNDKFLLGVPCYIVAYLSYFFTISTHLWIAVMGFVFWRLFVADKFDTIQTNNPSRFLKYRLFAWGMASGLLLITILTDHLLDKLDIDDNWKVGYGYYDCGLKMSDRSKFIYLFAPATLTFLIKTTFMIATVQHVHMKNQKYRKHLREMRQDKIKNIKIFTFFLRILTTEVLNWITGLCYLLYNFPVFEYLYIILISFNLIYCILIFTVTVTRKDVRQLLFRR